MPAQGRGAFLTPRAREAPPKATVFQSHTRSSGPPAPQGIGQAILNATHAAQRAVRPAVTVAEHAAAAAPRIERAAGQAGRHAQQAVHAPLRGLPNEVSAGLLRATVEQHPLLRYSLQTQLDQANLQSRAVRQRQIEQAHESEGGASALNLGFVNLTPLATKLATLAPLPSGKGVAGVLGRLGNEALDLPAQSFLSAAMAGSAAKKAALGNPGPLGELGGQVLQQIEHPVRSFEQAPLSTALLAAGGENILGRLAGRVGRIGEVIGKDGQVVKPGLIPSFTKSRPDLHLFGGQPGEQPGIIRPGASRQGLDGGLSKQQSYNADPLRKAFQVGREKSMPHLPGRLRQADPFVAQGSRLQRNLVGTMVKPGRVDYMRQAGERRRRVFVNSVREQALKLAPKNGRHAVPLIYQGLVRTPETAIADLTALRGRWKAAQAVRGEGALTSAQLKANKANIAQVDQLLADKHFHADMAPAFAAAERLRKIARPFEAIAVHGGILAPDQLRAKLFPYAQMHMGARQGEIVPPERLAAYNDAVATHTDAHAAMRSAESELRKAEAARSRAVGQQQARPVAARPTAAQSRAAEGGGSAVDAATARVRGAKERLAAAQHTARRTHEAIPAKPQPVTGMRVPVDTSYRVAGDHAPGVDSAPLHDLTQGGHGRVYTEPEDFMTRDVPGDRVTERIMREVRGKPDAKVTIYRAIGHYEGRTPGAAINAGDWVSLSKANAEGHLGALKEDGQRGHIVSKQVPARDVRWNGGNLNEFGYHPAGGGLRHLSDEEIYAHMRANGVKDVGFMSHKGGMDSSGSYYQSTTRLPGLEKHTRTGSAFHKGTADHSWEALVGSLASKASKAAQLEVRAHELSQTTMAPKGGGFTSRDHARQFAESAVVGPNGEDLPAGLGKLVPVHLGSDAILKSGVVNPQELQAALKLHGLNNEKSLTQSQSGKWGLQPEAVAKRIQAHDDAISAKSNLARGAQAYQNAFRAAKLNTSTRHVFGVGAEQAIRLLAEQAGPTSWAVGRKFDRALKQAAELDHGGHLLDEAGPLGSHIRALEAQLGTRGGQVQGYKDMQAIRAGRTWSDTTQTGQIAHLADGAARSKLGRAALAPWHVWSHLIEGNLARLEHLTHHALLGRALKDTGFIENYRSVLKLQDDAMHELVTKGLSSNKADLLARKVDDMMGNWSHLTPDVRKTVSYVAPFGLWWLNSMRWLYRLPVTHPVKTGIAAAIFHATEAQRASEGQGFSAPSPIPDFLQGTIPVNIPGLGPGHANPTYYSPGGTLGPDALNVAIQQFIPAIAGPVFRGLGLNPLTHKEEVDASGKKLGIWDKGLNALAEATTGPVPFATQAQQALEGGGKTTGKSNWITDLAHTIGEGPATTKPGTQRPLSQVLEKMFLPIRYAYETGSHSGGTAQALPSLTPREQHRVEQAERAGGGGELTPREQERLKRAEAALARSGR